MECPSCSIDYHGFHRKRFFTDEGREECDCLKCKEGAVFWNGKVPQFCDLLCGTPIDSISAPFVDGRTRQGPWGCLCIDCHKKHGVGLGLGKGQRYERLSEGRFAGRYYKVEG